MNFSRRTSREDPEINLIPMIDVLLVILIFLMITTTYSKFAGMEINLPSADAAQAAETPNEINITVTSTGEISVNRQAVGGAEVAAIVAGLQRVIGAPAVADSGKPPVVIINADAKTPHQTVIDVMQAAQQVGLTQISFATQTSNR